MRCVSLAILCVIISTVWPEMSEAAPVQREEHMVRTIEYWTNASDDAFPTQLKSTKNGGTELLVGSNEGDIEVTTIGQFLMPTDMSAFARLEGAAHSRDFLSAPNPASAQPGELIRQITVKYADGHDVERYVAESAPADRGFLLVEKEALGMVNQVRQHPERALSIDMTMSPGSLQNHMVLKVVLANTGNKTLSFPAPAKWKAAGMALHVTARRSDIDMAKMTNEDQAFYELGKSALLSEDKPDVALISIPPGKSQMFLFDANLTLKRGSYEVWGAMVLHLFNEQGVEFMQGELVSKRLPLSR